MCIVFIMLFLGLSLNAGEFEEANKAYKNGNYKEAFEKFKKLALKGNMTALNNMGVMYLKGQWVAENEKKAITCFKIAAKNGFVESQYTLATMYKNGMGTQKDASEAFRWYYKAAKQGYSDAQDALGGFYFHGGYFEQAKKYWLKAAEQGSAHAQSSLANIYCIGLVGKDKKKGLKEGKFWAKQALESGKLNKRDVDFLRKTCEL